MKKLLFFTSLLALGMVGVNGMQQPVVSKAETPINYMPGSNIIPNGDFAIGAGEWKMPSGGGAGDTSSWRNWNNAESTQVACVDPTDETNTVLRFTTYESAGFAAMFVLLPIESSATYDISFDFYAPSGTDNIGIAFWNITQGNRIPELNVMNPVDLSNASATVTDLTNGWKRASWTRTFTSDVFDSAHIWANVANGSIYFDNFTAVKQGGTENIFVGGTFEGWLDYATAAINETPDEETGIYGSNANYGKNCAMIQNNGFIGYKLALTEQNYELEVEFEGEGTLTATFVKDETELQTQELTSKTPVRFLNNSVKGATDLKLTYVGSESVTIKNVSLKPIYESQYDPTATYYESPTLTVNGDFEKFDVGTVFPESQLEGAWGSLASYDNPARVMEVNGSKCAVIGKIDEADTKTYSSMFLMTPEDLVIGDILRVKYDFLLTVNDSLDSYADINSAFVGGANVSYYKVDLGVNPELTTGAEKAHSNIKYEELSNGFTRVTFDFEVTNDIIQWNSIRWLFTAHNVGETLAIDNVSLSFLSTTPYTVEVDDVEINSDDLVMKVGDEKTLTMTSSPDGHDETTFTWSSSNEAVATVDQNGKVVAVGEGSCEITVEAENGVKDSLVVTVTKASVTPKPDSGSKTGLIIGISGGSAAIIGLALFFIFRKKRVI